MTIWWEDNKNHCFVDLQLVVDKTLEYIKQYTQNIAFTLISNDSVEMSVKYYYSNKVGFVNKIIIYECENLFFFRFTGNSSISFRLSISEIDKIKHILDHHQFLTGNELMIKDIIE
jgi:hypothetical protein